MTSSRVYAGRGPGERKYFTQGVTTGVVLPETSRGAMSAEIGRALADQAKRDGLKYFLVSFLDLFGVQRAKLVPASAIASVSSAGAGFAGFAAHFALSPADADSAPRAARRAAA